MMSLIRTMSLAFHLLFIVATAYGDARLNSSQEDAQPFTYYVPVSQWSLSDWVHYFTDDMRRRRAGAGNLTRGYDGVFPGAPLPRTPSPWYRRRLLTYDDDEVTSSAEARPRLLKRDLGRTALCLVVVCLALMVLLVCLSIAALWLRSRYRTRNKALYSTLSGSDPDLPTPATSSMFRRWQLSREARFAHIAERAPYWSRKVKRNSVSEPAVWNSKASGCSLDTRRDLSLRPAKGGDRPLAKAIETSEANTASYLADAVTTVSAEGRKSLHVKSTDVMLPLRPCSGGHADAAGRQPSSAHHSDHNEFRRNTTKKASGMRSKLRIAVDGDLSGQCNAADEPTNADSTANSAALANVKSTAKGGDLSEDYQQYSYSDEVNVAPDVPSLPLPTVIHRSVTKTVRRWRAKAAAAVSSLKDSSSAEPLVRGKALRRHPSALSGWLQKSSLESIAKPKDDSACIMTEATPWTQLLEMCMEPKVVDFHQILPINCSGRVKALRWNDGDGGNMFCIGTNPADERLVRVIRLLPQDIRIHVNRLKIARELCKLRTNSHNRTSAFFVDARTTVVNDKFPKVLWDALQAQREARPIRSAVLPEELLHPTHYLVTEIQRGWRPLSSYKFTDPEQVESVLEQACWALAVAEAELEFEHRLPIIDTVLIRPSRSPRVEYTLRGRLERIPSAGFKIRLQGFQMARMTIDGEPEYTELSRHCELVTNEEEIVVFSNIASILGTFAFRFKPMTNVLWLQHVAKWLMLQNVETTEALVQWLRVLGVATAAEDAAEEAADATASLTTGRRPVRFVRRRRQQPMVTITRDGDGTDNPSATGSSKQRQSSGSNDMV